MIGACRSSRQQRLEAERAHAVDQNAAVLGIAPAAPGYAAFGDEFRQRLMEGDDDMDRRREAVLPGLLEIAPLVVQVEHQRGGVALGSSPARRARQITKPSPGTPSMHLFDEAATASTA